MKMKIATVLLMIVTAPLMAQHFGVPPGSAPVHLETNQVTDANPYIRPGTLVVVELENIVMAAETLLGSEEWADSMQHVYMPSRGTLTEGRVALMPLWNRVLQQVKMRPVDRSIQAFIRNLQRNGCSVMGLSAKQHQSAPVMLEHLRSVDIDMSNSAPHRGPLELTPEAKLVQGVLFVGVHNNVGATLGQLFEQVGSPLSVVMLSHKYDHLREAFEGLSMYGVPFVGVRIGLADEKAAAYRPEVAEVQLNFFDRPLTNEAADVLLPKTGWFW